jgi:iron complex outermembrane recepter protein
MRISNAMGGVAGALAFAALAAPAPAPNPAVVARVDLTNLGLEDLMALEVTGVTGRSGTYLRSPAAVFVLTREDIQSAGARTFADVLRLVPGLNVVRSNATGYTVTSRGFGGDKLQVLIDGRSAYSPLQSQVFWDVFDTYLEDVARIEVIRGPGATIYGANAVNGVINIVTRPAADTQGTHMHAGGGEEERAFGGFRSGEALGDWGHGRAYVKARERDSTDLASGAPAIDGGQQVQAGTRVDAAIGGAHQLSFSGDIYQARFYSATFPGGATTDTDASGRNAGVRWTHTGAGGGETLTSLSYDGYDRSIPTIFTESRDTYNFDLRHNFAAGQAHRLSAGVGARATRDETGGPPLVIIFQPAARTAYTYSAFAQDEMTFGDWSFVLGTKYEHNDFTGSEVQPGVRVAWAPTKQTFTWASVARATRTPNRLNHDIGLVCTGAGAPLPQCTGPGIISIGNPDFDSETLVAYEWGLRSEIRPDLVADLALFFNDYDDLATTEPPLRFENMAEAEGYGGELTATWSLTPSVRLAAFYAYLKIDARRDAGSADATVVNTLENGSPEQSAGLRLIMQPLPAVNLDGFLRFVDSRPANSVPGYTELNLRAAWQVTPLVELSLTGENLLDPQHPETGAVATRSEIPRSIFAEVTWRWR